MGILENLKEIQVLMHSHRVIAQVAFRANKNPKASPACGYQKDSGSLRMAGARRANRALLVVLACDPCESKVTGAAVSPSLGLLIAFADLLQNVRVL
jgi:hypothetical protein